MVRKSVIVKHLTIAESPEKVVINKTLDMTRKCEKLKPRNRYKIARYSLDRKKDFMDQSLETDTDKDDNTLQKKLYLFKTRSSESDGRSDVTDCFDLQFVLIALIGLDCPDCPDWFRLP